MQRSERNICDNAFNHVITRYTQEFLNLLSNILYEERLFIIDSIQLKDNNGLNIDIKQSILYNEVIVNVFR